MSSISFDAHIRGMLDGDAEGDDLALYEGPGPREPISKKMKAITLATTAGGRTKFLDELDAKWQEWLQRPAPTEGLYVGMSFEDYKAIGAINISSLTWGVEGDMNEVRKAVLYPPPPTKNMRSGTCVHSLLLEPSEERVRLGPVNDKTQKCYGRTTNAWRDAQEQAGDVVLLDEGELARVHAMADAATAHGAARKLIGDAGETEVVLVWQDPDTGVWCKARTDKLIRRGEACVDYKSAAASSPGAFSKQLYNFNYYNQGAWYRRGLSVLASRGHNAAKEGDFIFIVGKSSAPYTVSTFELGAKSMELGTHENNVLLATFAACMKQNVWPGFGDDLKVIDVPHYAIARFEEGYGIGAQL